MPINPAYGDGGNALAVYDRTTATIEDQWLAEIIADTSLRARRRFLAQLEFHAAIAKLGEKQ
jgi:hypothetical protein